MSQHVCAEVIAVTFAGRIARGVCSCQPFFYAKHLDLLPYVPLVAAASEKADSSTQPEAEFIVAIGYCVKDREKTF